MQTKHQYSETDHTEQESLYAYATRQVIDGMILLGIYLDDAAERRMIAVVYCRLLAAV